MSRPGAERLSLRPATRLDARRLWEWRNDPETRAASFATESVAWEQHLEWLDRRLADAGCRILIFEVEDEPAGQARLDLTEDEALISFALAPAFRGRGLGSHLIELAADRGCEDLPVRRVVGLVREENERSLRAFDRAGFRRASSGRRDGASYIRVERECAGDRHRP